MNTYKKLFVFAVVITIAGLTANVALAHRNINSVYLNSVEMDHSHSITVSSGATISAEVTVNIDSGNWKGTGWRISTAAPHDNGDFTCVNTLDYNSHGDHTVTFNITAPTSNGTYNVYFRTFDNDSCTSTSHNGDFNHDDGVIVATSDTTPPTVSITGAPSAWINSDRTATVECSDAGGCNIASYKIQTYTSSQVTCPNYDDAGYTLAGSQMISSHVWVCGAAKDNASPANTGFSSPVEFKVDQTLLTASVL